MCIFIIHCVNPLFALSLPLTTFLSVLLGLLHCNCLEFSHPSPFLIIIIICCHCHRASSTLGCATLHSPHKDGGDQAHGQEKQPLWFHHRASVAEIIVAILHLRLALIKGVPRLTESEGSWITIKIHDGFLQTYIQRFYKISLSKDKI